MASVAKWNQEFIDSSGVFDINNRSNGLEAFNDIPSWEATEVPDRKNSAVTFPDVSSLNYKPHFPVSSISNGDLKPRETTNTVFSFSVERSQEMSQSQNRYRQNSNDSDEECVARQHLKHVPENLYKRESDPRHLFRDSSKFGNNETDSVDNEEYHVNSGFVNKLRSRFAKLENKNLHTTSLSKRSASVETLFASHYTPKTRSKFTDDINRGWEQNRKSTDDIGIVKPKQNVTSNVNSVTKPPPIPKRRNEFETKKRPESASSVESVKPKQPVYPHWTVAPDLNIGRDDIIIIESNLPAPKPFQKDVADEDIKSIRHSGDERIIVNELPKPKTVSSVRLYFEAVQSQADSSGSLFKRDSVSPPARSSSSPTRHSLGSNSPQILISPFSFQSPLAKKQDDNYSTQSDENVEKVSFPGVTPPTEQTEHAREEKTEPVAKVLSKWESHSTNASAKIRREKPVLKSKPELKPRVHNFISVKKGQEPDVKVSEVIKPIPETKESALNTSEANVSQVSKPEEISKLEIIVSHVSKSEEEISKPETDVLKGIKPDEGNKPDKQLLLINTADALTPVPTMSKVFDSKSIAAHSRTPRRSNRPSAHVSEPKVQVNSEHGITQNNEVQGKSVKIPDPVPSPTIEKIQIPDSPVEEKLKNNNLIHKKERTPKPKESVPSKTIIFDSSKIKKAKKPVPKRPVSPPKSVTDVATASFEDAKERISSPERSLSDTSKVKPIKPPRMSRSDNVKVSVNISHDINNVPKTEESISPINFKNEDNVVSSVVEKQYDSPNETVVRGIPSFLAEKLKKSAEQNNTGPNAHNIVENPDNRQLKTKSSHLENGSSSPVPKKKQAQDVSSLIESSSPTVLDQRKPSESPVQRSNIDDLISRKKPASYGNPICVFDSSKIASKRKDLPKRKPPKKTVQEINSSLVGLEPLTPLDLSSITNDTPKNVEYQEGYIATEIDPCPYVFEGAGVILNNTPLRKTKQLKLKLQFNDTATSTYEYEAEELALERYLVDHPDEKAEVEKEKLEILAMESSSSSTDDPDIDIHHGKEVVKAVALKTNTVLTAGGSLSNYKSKMQVDFKFGIDHQEEPEPEEDEEEPIDLNSQQLRPAHESELEAFSAEAHGRASDMLF